MNIIYTNFSGLNRGEFLNLFQFEDDTTVFETQDGWEVENFGTKSDSYYINIAKNFKK